MFKSWFDKHRKQRRQIRYRQGFDYAAGKLLRNPTSQTTVELENHIDSARTFGEFDEFDEGINDALNKFALISPCLVASDN